MPFRNAYLWLLALLAMTILGFWQGFFSQLGSDDVRSGVLGHIHVWTAMSWMLLLIFQAWSIQTKNVAMHRVAGRASLVLFPLLIGGLMAILDQAAGTYAQFGPNRLSHAILFQTGLPIIAYLLLFYRALAHRSNVWTHSANMLAMPFLLWESPFSRLLKNHVPQYMTEGFDIDSIVAAVQTGMLVAALLALIVWAFDWKRRLPILFVTLVSLLQFAAIETAFGESVVFATMGVLAEIPTVLNIGAGMLAGVIVGWLGWTRPRKADTSGLSQAVASTH